MRQVSIPVGVIVARHRSRRTAWQETAWRVAMVVAGVPAAKSGSMLWAKGGITLFYAGGAELSLHPSEIASYRQNLEQPIPLIYAVFAERAGVPDVLNVTAAPDEAEAYLDADGVFVDGAAMPPPVAEFVSAYVHSCGDTTTLKNGSTGTGAHLVGGRLA
jgi:hypothetical protein